MSTSIYHKMQPVEALCSSYSSGREPEYAFDGLSNTYWRGATSLGPEWIGGRFSTPWRVTKVRIHTGSIERPKDFSVDWSDDGITWVNGFSDTLANLTGWQDYPRSGSMYPHLYWRVYCTTRYSNYYSIRDVEFYGVYEQDFSYTTGIKIDFSHPIVTDPVDTAISTVEVLCPVVPTASSAYTSTYSADKAFDELSNTYWRSLNRTSEEWLCADLQGSKNITKIVIKNHTLYHAKNIGIQVSDSNIVWSEIITAQLENTNGPFEIAIPEAHAGHQFYRVYFYDTWGTGSCAVQELEIYRTEVLYHTNGFTVSSDTYDKSPEGELISKQYTIKRVTKSEDNLSLFIWLYIPDRLRYLASQLTVAYNKAIGSFMGAESMQVDNFSLSFAPVNVRTEPTPNEPIHLDADIAAVSEAIRIYYRDRATDESIEGTITVVSQIIHVDDIID